MIYIWYELEHNLLTLDINAIFYKFLYTLINRCKPNRRKTFLSLFLNNFFAYKCIGYFAVYAGILYHFTILFSMYVCSKNVSVPCTFKFLLWLCMNVSGCACVCKLKNKSCALAIRTIFIRCNSLVHCVSKIKILSY